ncbi:hypothetical protein RUM43_014601 [Polyplax serrata]|uniref:Phenoloxidase-activating factor 2 n=1 Tax=Polyplax serrata TaxID=468196 RepID=A0AAN8PIA2_POLSC
MSIFLVTVDPEEKLSFIDRYPGRWHSRNETLPRRSKRQITWQTLLSGPCVTSSGKLGRCTSFRACYPHFKVPHLNNWESWVLGIYDTCSYFTESGQQAFGVCCTKRNVGTPRPPQITTEPPTTTTTRRPVPVNPVPPNWPPPIPTHPPDHTIPPLPTHPPSPPPPPTRPTRPSPPTPPTRPTHPSPPTWPTQKPTTIPTQRPTTRPTQKPTRPTQRPTTRPTQRPTTRPTQKPTRPTTTTPRPTGPPTRPPTKWPPTPQPVKPIGPPAPPENEIFEGTCGTKNGYQDQERIVGGQTAEVNEWPWAVVLFNGGRQFCGGSLIDHEHILSAAHCVAHMTSWDVARLTVRLGDHNIRINTETRHIEKRVRRVVRHRGFDPRTLYNDIAILTLDTPVSFSKTIRPICLPQGNQNYAGLPATVIGWGSLRESGAQPAELQEVNIPIWTNDDCRLKYGPAAPGGIVDHFLCAGQASRDSCSGDSGGPLMVNQGRWIQVGIVSWGIGCGKGQYPGVYTRVTYFMPWITKNLN